MSHAYAGKTVCIVGLGYIGLPTAAMIASQGINVIGVDIDQRVVDTLNARKIHTVEPGLAEMVRVAVDAGTLRATLHIEPADVFILTVPTPFKALHEPDLSHVEAATRSLAPMLEKGNMVILESTAPVGATEQVATWLAEIRPDLRFPHQNGEASDIRLAYCPERVMPGRILQELVENDRVIGGMTPKCLEAAADLYRLFVAGECVGTDTRTAELCKLAENSFRDVNIAFANELSLICDKLAVNVWELIRLANRHPRVNILRPGCGVGGHCIAVDPWFIISGKSEEAKLIAMARAVNDEKPLRVIAKVKEMAAELAAQGKCLDTIRIACFGLAFKSDVDDLRESPALFIVRHLHTHYANQVVVVDPYIRSMPSSLADIPLVSAEEAVDLADIVVFLTPHAAFQQLYPLPPEIRVIDAAGVFSFQA